MRSAQAAEPIRPAVSVVIPTFRRDVLLRRCLDAVLAQALPGASFEIIVVDDAHQPETRQMIEALQRALAILPHRLAPDLRYLRPHHGRGPAVARNCGWRHAGADLVAFTDDDTVPQPGWLAQGVRAMTLAPTWAAACGRTVVPREAPGRRPTDHELMTIGLEQAEFITANAFVRVRALEQVGGFDERFTRPWREDSDLQFRLASEAGSVGRCVDAVVFHPVRPERWGVCLRQQRNVYFDALLFKKHRRLYRERILPVPPFRHYAIVALTGATLVTAALGAPRQAFACAAVAGALVLDMAWQRVRPTSRALDHVMEMILTSAIIPFLSVYWRLRGAWRFRVPYL